MAPGSSSLAPPPPCAAAVPARLHVDHGRLRGYGAVRVVDPPVVTAGDPGGYQRVVSLAACGISLWLPWTSLGFEHDSCGDSAGFEVCDRLVDLVKRACFADHACLAGVVQFEHFA